MESNKSINYVTWGCKKWKSLTILFDIFRLLLFVATKVIGYKSCGEMSLSTFKFWINIHNQQILLYGLYHGLGTPGEEIAFTTWPKINSQSQIFRYCRSIFCLPHRPKISDFFDLCLHWVSLVGGLYYKTWLFKASRIWNWYSTGS